MRPAAPPSKPRPSAARRSRGLTLVELMIVVTIIAIAAALAVPRLGGTQTTRLRAAAELLAADLAFAQIESIAHGDDPRMVVFDPDASEYHLAASSTPDTPLDNPVGGQPYRVAFGQGRAGELDGVSIQSLDVGGDDRLGFGLYGQLDQTEDASVTLALADQTVTLTIDAVNGRTTIVGP